MERPRRVRITTEEVSDRQSPLVKVILIDPENDERLGEVVSVEIPRVDPGKPTTAVITVLGPELDLIADASFIERCRNCGAEYLRGGPVQHHCPGHGDGDDGIGY